MFNPLALKVNAQCDMQKAGIYMNSAQDAITGYHQLAVFGGLSITLDSNNW